MSTIYKSIYSTVIIRNEKVDPSDHPNLRFVGLENVSKGTHKILGSVPSSTVKSKCCRFYSGDLLYGRLRPYLNKVVIANFEGLASSEFIVMQPNDNFDLKYLLFWLSSASFLEFVNNLDTGDRPRVNIKQIGDFRIRWHPVDLQKLIVAKIEQLFDELDKGVESLDTAKKQLEQYRQSVLKQAFEGKLTAEWREQNKDKIEPADKLLERIQRERESNYQARLEHWEDEVNSWESAGKKGKKPQKPKKTFKSETQINAGDHSGWISVSIGDLAEVGTGATPLKSNKSYYENGNIPWVTSGALNNRVVSKSETFVTERALEETNIKLFDPGTLLVAMYGEGKTRGKCSELLIQATTNQAIAAVQLPQKEKLVKIFLQEFLIYNYHRTRFNSSGGVQPNLNLASIKSIQLPLPSEAEIKVIVKKVRLVEEKIETSRKDFAAAEGIQKFLRQSILKQAFSGQLLPKPGHLS
ncbi:restriction endonuclease subunit S [Alphaproteobacteria bacterium]|nr:restriction endonuclease subunit S [Alphaproteobacteria bacterium]